MNLTTIFLAAAFFLLPNTSHSQSASLSTYDSVGLDQVSSSVRGNSECLADLELAFSFSGIVAKLFVDEGQNVLAGTVLVELDQEIEALEVKRREAIWRSEAELSVARIKAEVSAQQYHAAERLAAAGGAISLEDVQNRKLARDVEVVEVDRLEAQERIEELDFLVATAALAKRTMLSPSDGIVAETLKKPGESAQAYEPVVRLCDASGILFIANVPDALAVGLKVGEAVNLKFSASPNPIKGSIVFISPLVDAASGLRKVKIDLPEGLDWLRPGLSADLILQ